MEELDPLFTELASKSGGIEPLLQNFFSFLNRKTDFYVEITDPTKASPMGFPKGKAEKLLLDTFHRYPLKPYNNVSSDKPSDDTAPVASKTVPTQMKPSKATSKPSKPSTTPIVQYTSDNKQIPIGNGGIAENYYWTQTLKEITVYIDVPSQLKGKDFQVAINKKSLSVAIKNGKVLIDGELEEAIRVDESLWTLNTCPSTDSQIVITLDKTKKTWWEHVIIGHPVIDTTKVDSSQKMDDYDEETQAAIRKIVFEERQKNNSKSPV